MTSLRIHHVFPWHRTKSINLPVNPPLYHDLKRHENQHNNKKGESGEREQEANKVQACPASTIATSSSASTSLFTSIFTTTPGDGGSAPSSVAETALDGAAAVADAASEGSRQ